MTATGILTVMQENEKGTESAGGDLVLENARKKEREEAIEKREGSTGTRPQEEVKGEEAATVPKGEGGIIHRRIENEEQEGKENER